MLKMITLWGVLFAVSFIPIETLFMGFFMGTLFGIIWTHWFVGVDLND